MTLPETKLFDKRTQCVVCGSKNTTALSRIDYADEKMLSYLTSSYRCDPVSFRRGSRNIAYEIIECQACSLIMQRFVPNQQFLEEIYDEYIDPSESLSRKSASEEQHKKLYLGELNLVAQLINKPVENIKVLDYASGWGNWIRTAKKQGFVCYALELSEHRKQHLRDSGILVVNEEEMNSLQLEFVNCDQIFEHLTDPLEVLMSIKNVLCDGGILRVSVPHSFRPHKEISALHINAEHLLIPDILAPLEHLNYFNRKSLKQLAKQAGMEIVSVSLWTYIRTSYFRGDNLKTTIKNFFRPFYRYFFANIILLKKSD